MIGLIVDMLSMGEFEGVSKEIEIAKGKNIVPMTLKEAKYKNRRKKAWLQKS